ncbi:FitA-like ribbon-helix-helix domain-containing protein [Candidatus Palauibacter sp.]|uniref:FitA-like ribbon-helix-helix domain-containing protein n=2 Tax=Candidatus Palauibacter sp. TaxID=3101350 RepID=UPI003B027DBB
MGSTITVRDIDPGDKAWLRREARYTGISMEEFVRRLIHEKREKTEGGTRPSEVFERHFGPEYGVELPPLPRHGYKPFVFEDERTSEA